MSISNKCLYGLLLIAFFWGLWSLPYSPLAWFDEVILASGTHSLMNGHGLSLEVDNYEPMYLYGPVYFWLTGMVTKLLGFNIFGFRLTNFIFAFFSIAALGLVFKRLQVKKGLSNVLLFVFFTDAQFVSNSHSGRMEFVCIFLILLSLCIYLKEGNKLISDYLAISILLTVSMLTTPRAAVVSLPIALAALYKQFVGKMRVSLILYIIIPFLFYYGWIRLSYGSFGEMIAYFNSSKVGEKSAVEQFLGMSFHIVPWNYPLFITFMGVLVHSLYYRYFKDILFYVLPVILFFLLIVDTGPYSVLIKPFWLIVIAIGYERMISQGNIAMRNTIKVALGFLVLFNVSIFFFKSSVVLLSKNGRDTIPVTEWIKQNIPSGSTVVASYNYYYSVINSDCAYKRIRKEGVMANDMYAQLISKHDIDYIIVNEGDISGKACAALFEKEFVSEYRCEENTVLPSLVNRILKGNTSYSGIIYKVKK